MATTAPSALWGVYGLIAPHLKSEEISGIVGDAKHGSGYHLSPQDLRARGLGKSDYSLQAPADKRGKDDQAAGIDIKLNDAEMKLVTQRLRAACEANDARVECVREFIGCLDRVSVCGYNRYATGSGSRSRVGWVASGFSDTSHRWHIHISCFRDTVNDRNAMAGLAELICGLPAGALGWKADGSGGAKPKYLEAYIVDPLKVSTTLLANAPVGHDDLERKPGFRIYTGVRIIDGRWLETEAGYRYSLAHLVLESEFKARPPAEAAPAPKPPVPVVVEPKPAPAPNPPSEGPTFLKVAYVNPPGEGNWQGVIPTQKYWYLVEARKQKDGSEDCYVYRFPRGAEGAQVTTEVAPMHLDSGAKVHPTGWGVSESGVLWVTWNGEGLGNDVVTLNFAGGQRITKAQTQEMHMFTEGNAQIAFDVDNDMASVRVITKGYDTHYLRTKQDILDNKDRVLGTVKIPRKANRIVQGFTLVKVGKVWELRVLVGLKSAKSAYGIERWNAETGKHIATVKLPDELGREPEGIDGDLVGFKTENRSGIDVYRYTV